MSSYFVDTCSQLLPLLLVTKVFNWYLSWWRHWEMTSDHLFNNILSGSSDITNFSCKHKLHLLDLGLCSIIRLLHSRMSGWIFLFAGFQYSVDSFVSFLFFSTLKRFFTICVTISIKVVSQIPLHNLYIYFSSSQLI